ncbi:MAG: response regulator transcription factor [Pseudorhodoplanes sp.]
MGSPVVIAVVEDDASMLRSLERLLSVSGYRIESYPSAEAFLEKAGGCEASLLLLDIHLGGLSGIELQRRLNAQGLNIPTIFMTALDDEETHKDALAAGCIAYLQKPFSPALLIETIRKAAA